jgi:hypothetical protein
MDNEGKNTLRHISNTLDEVLIVLKKPANKFVRALEIGGAIVGVLAILGIIDIIRNWIIGG